MSDVRRMIREAQARENNDLAAVIGLCGLAGLRISEALSLRAADVRPNNGRSQFILHVRGKGNKVRQVPVSPALYQLIMYSLVEHAGTQEVLFPLENRTARDQISRMGRASQVTRPVASHDLRMTFATAIYDRTKDIRLVQELLGHADPQTTASYIQVSMANKSSAVMMEEA